MSEIKLFYSDPLVDRESLRAYARWGIEKSKLIRRCADGDQAAVAALLKGFWPFVRGFGSLIDHYSFPRIALSRHYDRKAVAKYILLTTGHLADMAAEEGEHASHWSAGAKELGIELDSIPTLPGMQRLLDGAASTEPAMNFYCWLAGTEYIAEELSRFLCSASQFLQLFPSGRWSWGDVHLLEHEGPSHLELDEDIARAVAEIDLDQQSVKKEIELHIRNCEEAFFLAAEEVHEHFFRQAAA